MICDCKDWKPNIDIINGYITMDAMHSWGNKDGYTGKQFAYCPWCGSKLKGDKDEQSTQPASKDSSN